MKRTPPARIHLLPVKSAPYVVVIRRKPTDWFHVMRWNTATDQLEHGSCHKGKVFVKRSDVSFDGNWLIFLARDFGGYEAWNRIVNFSSFTQVVNVDSDTYQGGGYWENESLLRLNGWGRSFIKNSNNKARLKLPFTLEEYDAELGDLGVLYRRLIRDGWTWDGGNWRTKTEVESKIYEVQCTGDDGWQHQPTPEHPTLRMFYTGYRNGNHQFKFWLEEFPNLINEKADWACWDYLGQLILSCNGILYKYDINGIRTNTPKKVINLEHLTPPDVRGIT